MQYNLIHSRQCGIVLKPRSDRTDHMVVSFVLYHPQLQPNVRNIVTAQAKRVLNPEIFLGRWRTLVCPLMAAS